MTDAYETANALGRKADSVDSSEDALTLYKLAWEAVPEPRFEWIGAGWIWNSISGIYFEQREYIRALQAAKNAEKSFRGSENVNTLFRLGAIYLDGFSSPDVAKAYFRRAWNLSDGRVFEGKPGRYLRLADGRSESFDSIDTGADINRAEVVELPENILSAIDALCFKGNALLEQGDAREALDVYGEALQLLPRPIECWSSFTWIQSAIGDALFALGEWERCEQALQKARRGPEGFRNPFISLRLGQCAYERGEMAVALDELMRAYMAEGEKIFSEDTKYLTFLKHNAELQ